MKKLLFVILVIGIAAVLFARGNAKASPGEYVVHPGDTLAEIAARYGVTVDDLVALNRDRYPSLVERPDRIEVGWRLRVPGRNNKIASAVMVVASKQKQPTPVMEVLPVGITDYSNDPREIELRIFELTNQARAEHGLAPLKWDEELAEIAHWRVTDMARRGYSSHYDPDDGTLLIRTRCETCAENLAVTLPSGTRFVRAWLNSPGHRANMLNPQATAIGVGVALRGTDAIGVQVFR